ncbi:3-(3-hydroxy-phenyl)propionate_3-hydroxycinnamic acid hydroxylase [Streptomyces sp. enrichment culture]|uniref:FAD-dependent monooxygenase n=1 Tax=Streptomyces sp. enrichment culture TaxID=1795815 RepID=UPI003F5578A1
MTAPLDVLVVGAGPTGLALATQLRACETPFRIVDRSLDRARESRAPAIQPRTLEMLSAFGVADDLVERGSTAVRLHLHLPRRVLRVPVFDVGCDDTPYPFLLFLPQSETEAALAAHLAERDVTVERGTELLGAASEGEYVTCRLRRSDGTEETVRARYVVGCDGAHSTVRARAGIAFEGHAYPQTFLLADLEADGLERGAAHTYLTAAGLLFFFPLGTPATWRMIAMHPPGAPGGEVTLELLQRIADDWTPDRPSLHDPVWMTSFRIHNRGATHYRKGPFFLAGDAAHIHSPAGGQGMNTGIQDALNLGWKLAHVCRGAAPRELLETYEAERAPVGHGVRRLTDRAFTVGTSGHPALRLARTRLAPHLAPLLLRATGARARLFRTVSELGIHYRSGPASATGPQRPRQGPRAGDRLPDTPAGLQRRIAGPGYHLLLTGPAHHWPQDLPLGERHGLLSVHRLGTRSPWPGVTQALVRPDGYVGHLARGTDLTALRAYLDRWLPAS